MRYTEREGYVLNGVPPAHMRRLAKLAEKRNTSLTNVAGAMLAGCFDVPFELSTRSKPRFNAEATSLYLMLPPVLLDQIREAADASSVTMRTVILGCLSESLGLKAPEPTHVVPGKRPGRPKEK